VGRIDAPAGTERWLHHIGLAPLLQARFAPAALSHRIRDYRFNP
jgi:hypothetical protein